MNLSHSILVSCFLLICAAGLMWSHRQSWRLVQQDDVDAVEHDYRRRQFRRRMQTSAMLGVLAVALPVVDWLTTGSKSIGLHLACWGVVLLLVVWIGLLALTDLIATKYHFGRMQSRYLVEEAKLKAHLTRLDTSGDDRQADP
ncbi:MAG TPA: hypothetical protein VE890_03765 [Thermoguttaceae bacterium]|nr:hypothetical protein [Thermoguttaceae bacterium]